MISRAKKNALPVFLAVVFPFCLVAGRTAAPSPASRSPAHSDARKPNPAAGQRLFERNCAVCHGIGGTGGRGPTLTRPRLARAPDAAALKAVITNGIPPEMPVGYFYSEQDVADIAAYVRALGSVPSEKLPGDPGRGAMVYSKSGCAGCHIIKGKGVGFGPELTEIGERRSSSHLQKTLASPVSTLPDDFVFVKAVTNSGQSLEGIRVNEDTFSIQIKDDFGKFYSLRKAELTELQKRKDISPMPSFTELLTTEQMQDLVAYLASLKGPQ